MFDNRTIAWYGNYLAGESDFLKAFFKASVEFQKIEKEKYFLKNSSDVPFLLKNENGKNYTIPASGEIVITFNIKDKEKYNVINLISGSNEYLKVELPL